MAKRRLRLFSLGSEPTPLDAHFSDADIAEQLDGEKTSLLFMGHFEKPRILNAFERFGILGQLRKLGYKDIDLEFRARGPAEHFLRLYDTATGDQQLLGEVVLREGRFIPETQLLEGCQLPPLNVLAIEWILMQHHRGDFEPDRRRLPGQKHPGLGLGRKVMDLLIWVATLLEKDALINIPEYFHNAVFYDHWFKFIDPAAQGVYDAILERLSAQGFNLAEISFAAYLDSLVDTRTGKPFIWRTSEQVLPRTRAGRDYLAHPEYLRRVDETKGTMSLTINRELFDRKMSEHNPDCEG